MKYRNDSELARDKKEVTLHFPLKKENKNGLKKENALNKEIEITESLSRFYKLTEKLRETEWHQEYFLIYNSYVIENVW